MKEDYLWDKIGAPDPEIQELEQILGTLRYEPKPLAIPSDLLVPRRRNYRPLLAIAAAVLFALLAGGVWLATRKAETPQPEVVKTVTPAVTPKEPTPVETPKPQNIAVVAYKPRRKSLPKIKRQGPEAELAKEQILLALRLASEKFNYASRKTQSPNQIRNQHKIG